MWTPAWSGLLSFFLVAFSVCATFLSHIWLCFAPAEDCLTILFKIVASKSKAKLRSLFSPFRASMEVTGQIPRRRLISAPLKTLECLNPWRFLILCSLLQLCGYCYAFILCAAHIGRHWTSFVQFFSNGCETWSFLLITTKVGNIHVELRGKVGKALKSYWKSTLFYLKLYGNTNEEWNRTL